MNGLTKCGIFIQWNFIQPQRRMKFCCLQISKWNWRTSSLVKLARLRKPKAACFLSHVEYRQIQQYTNTQVEQYYEIQVKLRGGHR
jgi:hypothetical protein